MKILIPIVPLILGVVSSGTHGRVRAGMLMDDERRDGCVSVHPALLFLLSSPVQSSCKGVR